MQLVSRPKVALDVDGVLANFGKRMIDAAKELQLSYPIDDWHDQTEWYLKGFDAVWDIVHKDPLFWLTIEPFDERPNYKPGAYITARPIPSIVTEAWLAVNNFPRALVITTEHANEKADAMRSAGTEVLVDDRPDTIRKLTAEGIRCYLFDRPWNRGFSYRRIYSVNDDILL